MNFPYDFLAAGTCTDHEQPLDVRFGNGFNSVPDEGQGQDRAGRDILLKKEANDQSRARNRQNGEPPVDEHDRAGNVFEAEYQADADTDDQRAQRRGLDDADQVGDARESPHALVNVEEVKTCDLDQNHERKELQHQLLEFVGHVEVETDEVGERPGGAEQQEIASENDEEITVEEGLADQPIEREGKRHVFIRVSR